MKSKKEEIDNTVQSLQVIPGVGPKLAKKFYDIGIKRISDLKGKKPEELYSQICAKQGIVTGHLKPATCGRLKSGQW